MARPPSTPDPIAEKRRIVDALELEAREAEARYRKFKAQTDLAKLRAEARADRASAKVDAE